MQDKEDVLTLVDEEGNEHLFSVVDLIKVEEKDYAILLPVEESEESEEDEGFDGEGDEAIIFRVVQDDEGQALLAVEDEDEWQAVATAWESRAVEDEEDDMDLDD